MLNIMQKKHSKIKQPKLVCIHDWKYKYMYIMNRPNLPVQAEVH